MNNAIQNDIEQIRRLARMRTRSRQRYEVLQQKAGTNPNKSPETVVAELERRKLMGQKDARDLDLADVDTRMVGALDGFNFLGNKTANYKTVIGRAVGANFDGATMKGRITGDINGSTMRRARIQDLSAPDINRNGVDDSGSVQARVDFSGGSAIGRRSVNVNAYLVSRDRSNNDRSVTHGGWQTQCFHEDTSYNGAAIINTGVDGSSFDRLRATKMEFRPKAKDEFSMIGAELKDSKLNPLLAIKATEGSSTLDNCTIAHEPHETIDSKPFNPFDALKDLHKSATSPALTSLAHRPRYNSMLGAIALGL